MSSPARRSLRTAIAALALAAVIPLAGCTAILEQFMPKPQAERDDTTQEVVEEGNLDVFTLRVGDCLSSVDEGEVSEVPVVPCDQPHDDEVYGTHQLTGDEFPGEDQIQQLSDEGCLAQFEAFAGIAYDVSTLDFYSYRPTQQSWEQLDDREVACVIYDPAGPVTGTLQGAAY
ncbi:septum formation family protein [Agromyces sp. G08B096]|uniref:Septum formation family protein n=1 Tax=Agromyces sp. G08B096 TaxID=3156399 RepID=A0AAU7WAR3_9MICO